MKRSHVLLAAILSILLVVPAHPSATDSWTSVRTRNLFLISNASAGELRQVAAWLEVFHDAFSRLTGKRMFDSSIPTVGIVFRSDQDFQPFKPLYQGRPADVAGYFQPGNDVNYITISLEHGGREPLSAAFHEYVHLYVQNNIPQAPLWINEGLAEFYSTFELNSGEATVGTPIDSYVQLLRNSPPLPLTSLLSVNQASAHYNDRDKRGVFYAESWALVHYLMLGNNGQRQAQLRQYLNNLAAGVSLENSFKLAFQTTVEAMQKELGDYIQRNTFPTQRVTVGSRDGYGSTETRALSRAEATYYLGDLLLHTGRTSDAERYFTEALSLDPGLVNAHAALGLLRVEQGRHAEALRHLERAAPHSQNHLVHFYYSYVLSRQGMKDGYISSYTPATLNTIRTHLQTTIKLSPNFAEAYHLLAFVNLVSNEQLDQSVELIKRAISIEPAKAGYKLVLAQLYLKQGDRESGTKILESLARQTDDKRLRTQAESLLAGSYDKSAAAKFSSPAMVSSKSSSPEGSVSSGMKIDNSGPMPELSQVLAKYADALGGEARLRQLKSRVTVGTARMPKDFTSGRFETYEKFPNKALTVIKAGRGEIFGESVDGSVGWRQTPPAGVRRLTSAELAELQRDYDFYTALRLRNNYAEVKVLGKVKIGYRETYLVEAKPPSGEPDRLYFEASSGLLIRWDGTRSSWRGRALFEVYFDDWREVDGVKIPFRVTRSSPQFTIVFTVEDVKHDLPIADQKFSQGVVGN